MGFMYHELFAYATGSAVVDHTVTGAGTFEIREVRLHMTTTGGASENFTVKIDSAQGSGYDVVLTSQDMNAVADYVWRPTPPALIASSDAIVFSYTNTNSRAWGLEMVYKKSDRDTALTIDAS